MIRPPMISRAASLPISVIALALTLAGAAYAKAPEPRKPVELDRLDGRWYEILRTANRFEKNCFAGSQTWSRRPDGRFSVTQSCHTGSLTGPEKRAPTNVRVIDAATNAKFEASFFAGLIHEQYWIVDHAEDYSWMIGCTSGGNYVTLFARQPALPASQETGLVAHIGQLGFDTGRLVSGREPGD